MDVSIMGILAFLYVTILLHLIANDLRTENRSFCLYAICVRCVRYILYGQELEANELENLGTDENHDSIKQSQKLHEISLEEPLNNDLLKPSTALTITSHSTENDYTFKFLQNTSLEGLQKSMGQLSGMNPTTVSSGPEPIASCSIETKTGSFPQDASSEISALQELMGQLSVVKPSTVNSRSESIAGNPTETNTDSTLQDASSETSGLQELMDQLSVVNRSPVIYEPEQKTNPDTKVLPSIALTNTSYSTETNNTFSFLEDASTETSCLRESIGLLYKMNPSIMSSGSEHITSCSTETNTYSILQDVSSDTTGIQKPMGQLSVVSLSTISSGSEPITICSTEANTDSLLQDASSHTTCIQKHIGQLSGMNSSTMSSGSEPTTGCSTETNTDTFLQDTSSHTTGIQKPIAQLSRVNPSTMSSGSEHNPSCSIQANTDSFLQDVSSDTTGIQKPVGELSDPEHITNCSTVTNTDCISPDVYSETDFDRLFLQRNLSMALTTIETSKEFEISVCELSERDLQKHSVMDGILPIWWTTGKESHSESNEFVQCSLNELKSKDYSITDYSCDISLESNDRDNTLRTLVLRNEKPSFQLTEFETFEAFNIDKKVSAKESQNVCSKNMIPAIINEGTSEEKVIVNIIKEIAVDEICQTEQSSLDTIPIEFLYPCLPILRP